MMIGVLALASIAFGRALMSKGCARERPVIETDAVLNRTVGDRRYLLFIPSTVSLTNPAPLILSYHGGNRIADSQLALDKLTDRFFNEEYIVIYPYGIDRVWQGVPGVETDDVAFTEDILDEVEQELCIDRQRIFATGKSDGGGMVGVLACDSSMSKRIAAFAPVSAAFYIKTKSCKAALVDIPCDPGRNNIPMLELHGGNDTTIRYEGGKRKKECLPTIPHWVQAWAERDGLGMKNKSSWLTRDARKDMFGTGSRTGLVTHIYGGDHIGHDWPATVENADNERTWHSPASFNASSIILEFFKAHPLDLERECEDEDKAQAREKQ